ncbi:MAG: hypothetical protein U5R46_00350 [Gammaproteobacteria bacterium]|nr:hypothetical protein [Gammaproteobacteria bacterium]
MHLTKPAARAAGFLAVITLFAIASADPGKDVLRILPLGDSITQADAYRASYRYPLWKNARWTQDWRSILWAP